MDITYRMFKTQGCMTAGKHNDKMNIKNKSAYIKK